MEVNAASPPQAAVKTIDTASKPALAFTSGTLPNQNAVELGGIDPPADGPPQMAGVARPWEDAVVGAPTERLVVMRTGPVMDAGTPAFDRLARLTKFGLGGRISTGEQWVSWIHVDDFLRAVRFIVDIPTIGGAVHVTAPEPIQNRDMMATLRSEFGRPWSPPTPKPLVHLGALFLRTDPALALTGRRCVRMRLLDAGFEFEHPTFPGALSDLVDTAAA